jgi:hypothetical protein
MMHDRGKKVCVSYIFQVFVSKLVHWWYGKFN